MLPQVINNIIEADVSFKRIQNFLLSEEIIPVTCNVHDSPQVKIENACFSWPVAKEGKSEIVLKPCLHNITFQAKKPELIAVVGPVGCGKTSLISAILGDSYCIEGKVEYTGKIAYVPQTAYIQNATLKENILFGKEYNEEKYHVNKLIRITESNKGLCLATRLRVATSRRSNRNRRKRYQLKWWSKSSCFISKSCI